MAQKMQPPLAHRGEVFQGGQAISGIWGLGPGPEGTGQQAEGGSALEAQVCLQLAAPPPGERAGVRKNSRELVLTSHPRGKDESPDFSSRASDLTWLAWPSRIPGRRQEGWGGTQEGAWDDEGEDFSCDPDGEARRGEPGPVPPASGQGPEVVQRGDGTGALDVRAREGCCISQLGRNQCNGPFQMCIKILRIPHFNIKYS